MATMTKRQKKFVQGLKNQIENLEWSLARRTTERDDSYAARKGAEQSYGAIIESLNKNIAIQQAHQNAENDRADQNLQRSIQTAVATAMGRRP